MGRALIVGADQNFCLKLRSFLESEDFIVTMTSNRTEGIERLFYEKPDLTLFEFFTSNDSVSPELIYRINSSGIFEIVDIDIELEKKPRIRRVPGFSLTKPVFILEDPDRVEKFFSSFRSYLGLTPLYGLYKYEEEAEAEEIKLEKMESSLVEGIEEVEEVLESENVISEAEYVEEVGKSEVDKNKKRLGEILIEAGLITETELEFALKEQSLSHDKLGQILLRYKFISEDELITALAKQSGIHGIDILHEAVDKEVLQVVPKDLIKKYGVMPIGFDVEGENKKLIVAMSSPKGLRAIDEITFASGYGVCPVFARQEDLALVIRQL